jgi:hypothetical protein
MFRQSHFVSFCRSVLSFGKNNPEFEGPKTRPGEGEGTHAVPCGCRPRGYCHLCLVGLDASSGEPNAHMLLGKPDLKNMGQSIINYVVSWDVPGSTGTWSRQNHVSNVEHLCPCARVCVCVSVMIVHVCLSAESFCSAWGSSMTSWQLLNCWQHSCACLFSSIQLRHRSLALPKKLRRQLSAKKRRHPADTTAPSCFPQCQPPRLGRTNTQFCTPMTGCNGNTRYSPCVDVFQILRIVRGPSFRPNLPRGGSLVTF